MPNKLKKETEQLVEIIKHHPDGISVGELLNFIGGVTPRRAVQYRLSTLVKSGILRMQGAGRSSKYCINQVVENRQTESAGAIPNIADLATLEAMREPDPFRARYRDLIRQAVCGGSK